MRTELETTLLHCRNLPSPPGVALQIIALAQDPNATLGAAAHVIGMDPALSARLLRVANSPLYATRRRTETLAQAMAMLGLNATLSLALGFSLVHGLRGHNGTAELQERIWRRSVLAAMAARLLGQQANLKRAETLMLAGLLQDIGRLALLQAMPEEYSALCARSDGNASLLWLEREAYDADHADVGAWLARRWHLPDFLVDTIAGSESVSADDAFLRCVQASGPIADLWLAEADDSAALRQAALDRIEACTGRGIDALDEVLSMMAASLPEISAIFEVRIEHPAHLQAISDEAKELLVLRNLRQIQDATQAHQDVQVTEERMRQLTEQARRDPLTGVYNRLHMEEVLEREFAAATMHPMTVALIDLDDFKQINDRYGHLVGDQVLRQFAQTVQRVLRSTDFVARYGGEEFLLVLNYSNESAAEQVLQRLLNEVSRTPMAVVDGQPVHTTFSAGIATHNNAPGSQFDNVRELLQAADNVLYGAKRDGRNRVRQHGTQPGESD
jgi:diguanylate cyclase (GGDEF)-like protein